MLSSPLGKVDDEADELESFFARQGVGSSWVKDLVSINLRLNKRENYLKKEPMNFMNNIIKIEIWKILQIKALELIN